MTSEAQPDSVLTETLARVLGDARKLENGGKLADALRVLHDAPQSLRAFATWHYAVGSLHFRMEKLERATTEFEEAVRLEPEVSEFWSNLGASLIARFQKKADDTLLTRAVEVLEKSVSLSPRLPDPFNNLGHALLLQKKLDAALRAFDGALKMHPDDVPSLFNKAATLHAMGREQDCLAALDAVLKIAPDFEPAKQSRANTLKRLKK